jgi:phosphopantothenoylcysteine synthetase/decarboxylase
VAILYVVATGARAAGDLPSVLPRLIDRGWTCCVVLTPDGTKFVDQAQLERLSGYPVRSVYKQPDEPDVHPAPDAFLVAPLTFSSLNRWADGHSDTVALGLLNEALGLGRPIVAVPWINAALAAHPAVPGNLARLREAGVRFILDNGLAEARPKDNSGGLEFPWDEALDALPPAGEFQGRDPRR